MPDAAARTATALGIRDVDASAASPKTANAYHLQGFREGSSGRTRTYNPPVNSRMLYH
jgi:hypothetical protein